MFWGLRDAIQCGGKIEIETRLDNVEESEVIEDLESSGEFVVLSVKDNGCGMDEETVAHIFEPFFTTKDLGKGTGLGLATVFGIVKQNAGFIRVNSEKSKGTTFSVFLPRHAGKTSTGGEPREELLEKGGQEVILLVEDDPNILKMTKSILEKLNYRVFAANHPLVALEIFAGHGDEIDLLLSDLVMPEMNGLDLALQMSAQSKRLRVLLMSGYGDEVFATSGLSKEKFDFLQKPFCRKDLSQKIKEVLRNN